MDKKFLQSKFGLENKVAIVTGTSRGLGKSMALALGKAGARVCLVGRQENLDDTQALMEKNSCQSIQVICDQTKPAGVKKIFSTVIDKWGKVDILVNNAGTFLRKPSIEWKLEDWDYVMDLNLRSVFMMCQAAGKCMLPRETGKIINISSILSFQGGVTVPAYTASRHGVMGLTRSLANEWAAKGINVNAIAPGYMDTDQNTALFNDPIRSKELMARIPAKRWGKKEEIDGACLFLSSESSNYMNGQTMIVDGGWMSR